MVIFGNGENNMNYVEHELIQGDKLIVLMEDENG